MNTFTIGARVRHKELPEMGVGVVTSLSNQRGHVEIQFEGRNWTTRQSYADAYYEFLPAEPAFKVGDTVLICDLDKRFKGAGSIWYTPDFAGLTGTVVAVYDTDCVDVIVIFKGDKTFPQYIHPADLTLVTVEPVAAVKAAKPKVRTIKDGSQCDRIVKFLASGNTLTPLKARQLFGAERLAARILEIKQAGHKIVSTTKTDLNGKVYAEYSLRKAGRVWAA